MPHVHIKLCATHSCPVAYLFEFTLNLNLISLIQVFWLFNEFIFSHKGDYVPVKNCKIFIAYIPQKVTCLLVPNALDIFCQKFSRIKFILAIQYIFDVFEFPGLSYES